MKVPWEKDSKAQQIFRSEHCNTETLQPESYRQTLTKPKERRTVDERFEWAYQVWRRKGLLGEKFPENKDVFKSSSKFDDELDKKLKKRRATLAGQKQVVMIRESQDVLEPDKSRRQSLPAAKHATAKQGKSFANILEQWKTVSDNKPCSHFLSPEQTQRDDLEIKRQSIASQQPSRRASIAGNTAASSTRCPRDQTAEHCKSTVFETSFSCRNPASAIPENCLGGKETKQDKSITYKTKIHCYGTGRKRLKDYFTRNFKSDRYCSERSGENQNDCHHGITQT